MARASLGSSAIWCSGPRASHTGGLLPRSAPRVLLFGRDGYHDHRHGEGCGDGTDCLDTALTDALLVAGSHARCLPRIPHATAHIVV